MIFIKTVKNSILSGGVIVEEGAEIHDSVIMEDVVIKKNGKVYSAIVDADAVIESGAVVGKDGAGKDDISVIASGSIIEKTEI